MRTAFSLGTTGAGGGAAGGGVGAGTGAVTQAVHTSNTLQRIVDGRTLVPRPDKKSSLGEYSARPPVCGAPFHFWGFHMTRWLAAFAVVLLSACSFGPKLVRPDVDTVKKVAIVGFRGDVSLQDGNSKPGGIIGTVGAVKTLNDVKSGKMNERRVAQATTVHTMLTDRLSTDLGWTMVPAAGSDTLKERVRQKPTGLAMFGVQHVSDLMLDGEARFLAAADRQKIITELGVDAVMTVNVQYRTADKQGFAIGGLGSFKLFPRATVTVQVWNATQDKPVWEDSFAMGQTSAKPVTENAGMLEDSEETEALIEAAKLGIDELIGRYRAAPTKG